MTKRFFAGRFCATGGDFLLSEPAEIFTPEQFSPLSDAIARTAREFLTTEVLPQTPRIEAGDHPLMHALMRRAGQLGLLAADIPEIYGGLDLDIPTAARIAEELNPQQSFALTHEAHTVIATLPLLYFGTHAQKKRYLPDLASGERIGSFALSEANSGSDALALRTRATLTPDGRHFRLSGMKTWITNSAFARLFTVFARTDDTISAFLVDRDSPGLSFGPEENKLGMRGTSTRRVIFDDVRVPIENVLPLGTGHYAALCALNLGRFKLEAGAVGGLKFLIETTAKYVSQRRAFGRTLAQNGLVQSTMADMIARTFALESSVYRLAGALQSRFGEIDPTDPGASARYHRAAEEYAIECNVVKVLGSEAYSECADDAIQLHGGYGYTENFPVARAWRDQRLLRIGEGANEIVRVAIVQWLLRRERAGRLASLTGPLPDEPFARLALLLLRRSVEHFGESGLLEAQEAAAPIADLVCAAYAMSSMKRRALATGDCRFDPHIRVARLWFGETCARAARTVLACQDAKPSGEIADLIDALQFPEINPLTARRELVSLYRETQTFAKTCG